MEQRLPMRSPPRLYAGPKSQWALCFGPSKTRLLYAIHTQQGKQPGSYLHFFSHSSRVPYCIVKRGTAHHTSTCECRRRDEIPEMPTIIVAVTRPRRLIVTRLTPFFGSAIRAYRKYNQSQRECSLLHGLNVGFFLRVGGFNWR